MTPCNGDTNVISNVHIIVDVKFSCISCTGNIPEHLLEVQGMATHVSRNSQKVSEPTHMLNDFRIYLFVPFLVKNTSNALQFFQKVRINSHSFQ